MHPQAHDPTRALVLLLLSILPAMLLSAAILPAEEAAKPDQELRALLETLFASAAANDRAAFDDTTCLDDFLRSRLRREAALGLTADADDPARIAERRRAARVAMRRFVTSLAVNGQSIADLDTSRVTVAEAGGEEAETLVGASGETLEITASGLVGVWMTGRARVVDLAVYRLGARWCVDPLSVPRG